MPARCASYRKMMLAYMRTFQRLGLKAIPMEADTGPIGGDLSHEFIILAPTGESQVFCDTDYLELRYAARDLDFDDARDHAGRVRQMTSLYAATRRSTTRRRSRRCRSNARISARGIEVGHIFYFGTKYSLPMKAVVNGPDGEETFVHMGSYGIGPAGSRRR